MTKISSQAPSLEIGAVHSYPKKSLSAPILYPLWHAFLKRQNFPWKWMILTIWNHEKQPFISCFCFVLFCLFVCLFFVMVAYSTYVLGKKILCLKACDRCIFLTPFFFLSSRRVKFESVTTLFSMRYGTWFLDAKRYKAEHRVEEVSCPKCFIVCHVFSCIFWQANT